MTIVFDSGALIALERNDRPAWRRLNRAVADGTPPITHGGVVAQVWRGGQGRQALLARAMAGILVVPLGAELGRRAGDLLARSLTTDAIDAAVVALANDGDDIITSDVSDLRVLIAAQGLRVRILDA